MKAEVRQQIGEWGTAYEAVRRGWVIIDGEPSKFEGSFTFEWWYEHSGYGGDPNEIHLAIQSCLRIPETGFYHFITGLEEHETAPSERTT